MKLIVEEIGCGSEKMSETKIVKLSADKISEITHATAHEIRRFAKLYKYCFYVPAISRRPRCPKNMSYVAVYTKDRHFAFVFTDNSYLLKRKYAVLVSVVS